METAIVERRPAGPGGTRTRLHRRAQHCINSFNTRHQQVGMVNSAFPAQVQYPTSCGPMCRTRTPPKELDLMTQLTSRFTRLVSSLGPPNLLALKHVVLAFEVHCYSQRTRLHWAGMPSASARAGPLEPRQNFVEYSPIEELRAAQKPQSTSTHTHTHNHTHTHTQLTHS